jgi:hypothetical protein
MTDMSKVLDFFKDGKGKTNINPQLLTHIFSYHDKKIDDEFNKQIFDMLNCIKHKYEQKKCLSVLIGRSEVDTRKIVVFINTNYTKDGKPTTYSVKCRPTKKMEIREHTNDESWNIDSLDTLKEVINFGMHFKRMIIFIDLNQDCEIPKNYNKIKVLDICHMKRITGWEFVNHVEDMEGGFYSTISKIEIKREELITLFSTSMKTSLE